MNSNTRIALTWGDCGENHAGNQQVGKIQETGTGVTMDDLKRFYHYYTENVGGKAELRTFSVPENCPHKDKAGVLILRNFLDNDKTELLLEELLSKTWDSKFLNKRTNKVLNKHARENLIFMRGVSQEAEYEKGKGTIENIDDMPILSKVDNKMREINKHISKHTCDLICEGNKYRIKARIKTEQQGIGWHGDAERIRVFALSVGGKDYCIKWCLFHQNAPQMEPEEFYLNSGDVYIMSELAVGQQWNKSSLWTWRHAAGHEKYVSLKRFEGRKKM